MKKFLIKISNNVVQGYSTGDNIGVPTGYYEVTKDEYDQILSNYNPGVNIIKFNLDTREISVIPDIGNLQMNASAHINALATSIINSGFASLGRQWSAKTEDQQNIGRLFMLSLQNPNGPFEYHDINNTLVNLTGEEVTQLMQDLNAHITNVVSTAKTAKQKLIEASTQTKVADVVKGFTQVFRPTPPTRKAKGKGA